MDHTLAEGTLLIGNDSKVHGVAAFIQRVDFRLEQFLRSWNIWTSLLFILVFVVLLYPLIVYRDPDTHPLLLSRQANASPVRQSGESAIYRSLEIPYGYPLRTGLNVKDPGTSKWTSGRDGDLRDVWRAAVTGQVDDSNQPTGKRGKLYSVFGTEQVQEHDLDNLSKQMNIIGQHVKRSGASYVTIYLPNSVETLLSLFASAFYGFTPLLLPFDQPLKVITTLSSVVGSELLIAAAGSVDINDIRQHCPNLKHVVWVVEEASRDMDWTDPSKGESAWHELVADNASQATSDLPTSTPNDPIPDLVTIWQNERKTAGELVKFTQRNLTAAIGAQLSALPSRQRLSIEDLFLPADSLSNSYILVLTLAAMYSNSSVALNSVAGWDVDLIPAAAGISPTIVAASAETALKLHQETSTLASSSAKRLALRSQTQALEAGMMPQTTMLTSLNPPVKAALGKSRTSLRLLYIYERMHANSPPISSRELSEIRAFTGARVIYSLTTAMVAGTIAQTTFYDYRRVDHKQGGHSHFGPPVSSVELKVIDTDSLRNTNEAWHGEVSLITVASISS